MLNYSKYDWITKNQLLNSITTYFNVNKSDINLFNPNFHLFKEFKNTPQHICFNNSNKLIKLESNDLGLIFSEKTNELILQDIYIKKISFIQCDFLNMDLFNKEPTYKYYNQIYNTNSPANIEIFLNYVVSRIYENNLSPSFNMFYCVFKLNDPNFEYNLEYSQINNKANKLVIDNLVNKNLAYINFDFNTDSDSDFENSPIESEAAPTENESEEAEDKTKINLTIKNHPCYVLITERNDISLFEYLKNNGTDILPSIIFQINMAIMTMYELYKIKNNDLHIGNIMLKKTDKQFLYYKYTYKETTGIYRIPTYGYIAKIIDWGRATYEINNIKGYNTIFNSDNLSDFYVYNNINDKSLLPEKKPYSDISMFSYGILNTLHILDKQSPNIEQYLKQFIKKTNNKYVDYTKFNWDIFRELVNNVSLKKNYYIQMFLEYFIFYSYNEEIPKTEILYNIVN